MKKHPLSWLAPFAIVLIISVLRTDVYAHPGKTDSSGGHTDHSTGDYHYHHGYSAHDHYDMDGDGDVDCPYDFDDRTESNSGTPLSRSNSSSNYSSYDYIPVETVTVYKDREVIKEVPYTPTWIKWSLGISLFFVVCLFISNRWKKQEIVELEHRHKSKIDEIVKLCDAKLAEKQASDAEINNIRSAISEAKITERRLFNDISSERKELLNIRRMRCFTMEAPLDISFSDDGLPVYWKPRLDKPYGDYTVFISLNSGIYHTDSFCAGYRTRKDHIFNVIGHARPCKKCAVGFFDFTSAPDWFAAERAALETNNPAVPPDDPNIKVNYR